MTEIPQGIFGVCVQAGDGEDGQPRMIVAVDKHSLQNFPTNVVFWRMTLILESDFHKLADRAIHLSEQNAKLRAALERIASTECFDMPRAVKMPEDAELMARIEFAKAALEGKE